MFETLALPGAVVSDVFQHQWQLLRPKSYDVCFFLNTNRVNTMFALLKAFFMSSLLSLRRLSSFIV